MRIETTVESIKRKIQDEKDNYAKEMRCKCIAAIKKFFVEGFKIHVTYGMKKGYSTDTIYPGIQGKGCQEALDSKGIKELMKDINQKYAPLKVEIGVNCFGVVYIDVKYKDNIFESLWKSFITLYD